MTAAKKAISRNAAITISILGTDHHLFISYSFVNCFFILFYDAMALDTWSTTATPIELKAKSPWVMLVFLLAVWGRIQLEDSEKENNQLISSLNTIIVF